MTRSFIVLRALFLIVGPVAFPSAGRAMSTYYTAQGCSACHGSSTVTCNGCHHHGPVNLSAVPNKTTFAPGETITVTLNGGSQSGWFRAAILDQSNAVLVKKSGTVASGAVAPSNGATYPVTLTVAAPSTAGTYTWKGAWYGNGYDSGGTIGGSGYIADPNNGNHGYQPVSFTFTVAAPAPVTCTSFTYSTWSACSSSGTQTRTVLSSSPTGCTGGTPVTTQSCTYVPPTCTSWTYSAWGACQPDGTQSRTAISSSPSGCTGGSPTLTQACTYTAPTCTSFTYSTWSACQSNDTQTRTVLSSSPTGCTGGTPITTQSCTYVAPTCTYTYSSWSVCSSSGTQTRTVLSSAPTGCTGTPLLSQSCTPPTTTIDGAALYTQYCASCHGPLSSSSKAGATATQIQTGITTVGAMSSLSFLTSAQIQAIADALATTTTTPPPTTGACGSCHALPPDTGKHVFHVTSEHIGCSTCHGSGYDATKQTVNANTHQDGKVELTRKLRWDSATQSCSPNCHGTQSWTTSGGTGSGGNDGHGDDIVIVDDGEPMTGGCSSAGGSAGLFALAGLAVFALVRRRARHQA